MDNKLDIEFEKAFEIASNFKGDLPPDTMLRFYAYYKQAVKGDKFTFNANNDLRNAFKFNAWIQLKGMDENEAKQEYINLVNSIIK
ncbi:acyl-CoA-binding protein [Tenacibaculum aestuariivivum]|uniref:acyl-CoA-binding protein n=1 Tax=Tenacibaculum aestuariivivum TaxID=2006131 RepID=UPI003AB6366F